MVGVMVAQVSVRSHARRVVVLLLSRGAGPGVLVAVVVAGAAASSVAVGVIGKRSMYGPMTVDPATS